MKPKKRTTLEATSISAAGQIKRIKETVGSVTPAGMAVATTAAAKQTAKDQLEAQIAARQKLLKLLRKKAAANDAAVKAKLQLRINQLQAQTGLQPAATPLVPTTAAAVQSTKRLGQAMSSSPKQHKQQQPLAGITGVLANTPVEQARRAERQQRFAADLVAAKSINTSSSTTGKAGLAGGVDAAHAGIGEPSSWLRLEGGCGTNRWAGGGELSSI
eukprot:gene3257-3535_t